MRRPPGKFTAVKTSPPSAATHPREPLLGDPLKGPPLASPPRSASTASTAATPATAATAATPATPAKAPRTAFDPAPTRSAAAADAASPAAEPTTARQALSLSIRLGLKSIGLFGPLSTRSFEQVRSQAVDSLVKRSGGALSREALCFDSLEALAEQIDQTPLSAEAKLYVSQLHNESAGIREYALHVASRPLEMFQGLRPGADPSLVAGALVREFQGELSKLLLNAGSTQGLPPSVAVGALRHTFFAAVEQALEQNRELLQDLAFPVEQWIGQWRQASAGPLDEFARLCLRWTDLNGPDDQVAAALKQVVQQVTMEAFQRGTRPGEAAGAWAAQVEGRGASVAALQAIRPAVSEGIAQWIDATCKELELLNQPIEVQAQRHLAQIDFSAPDDAVREQLDRTLGLQLTSAQHQLGGKVGLDQAQRRGVHSFLDAFTALRPQCSEVIAQGIALLGQQLTDRS